MAPQRHLVFLYPPTSKSKRGGPRAAGAVSRRGPPAAPLCVRPVRRVRRRGLFWRISLRVNPQQPPTHNNCCFCLVFPAFGIMPNPTRLRARLPRDRRPGTLGVRGQPGQGAGDTRMHARTHAHTRMQAFWGRHDCAREASLSPPPQHNKQNHWHFSTAHFPRSFHSEAVGRGVGREVPPPLRVQAIPPAAAESAAESANTRSAPPRLPPPHPVYRRHAS